MSEEKPEGTLDNIIRIDDARIRDHLGEMVRGTVEEALNAMLAAEADRLCGGRPAMSVQRARGIREPAAITVCCIPRPVMSN